MPAGRPTSYDPSFCEEVDKYLKTATRDNAHLPKLESFATWLNVSRDSLHQWSKNYPEFSDALERIKRAQAERLIDDGIYGGKEVNATIVKLLLQNNHGMKERKDYTSGDKPIPLFTDKDVQDNNSSQEANQTQETN